MNTNIFVQGPILLHSAYLCKQVAQTYRDEELENEVSNSSDAQPQTFASKMYTGFTLCSFTFLHDSFTT